MAESLVPEASRRNPTRYRAIFKEQFEMHGECLRLVRARSDRVLNRAESSLDTDSISGGFDILEGVTLQNLPFSNTFGLFPCGLVEPYSTASRFYRNINSVVRYTYYHNALAFLPPWGRRCHSLLGRFCHQVRACGHSPWLFVLRSLRLRH